jgi:peptidoglycan/xylan/chitin deacetylase (PgdA/CDA1 family)
VKAILTWHAVEDLASPITVARSTFEHQVAFLASGEVRVVPLAEIGAAPDNTVALTFDDAFVSFTEYAWPRLLDAGLPATVFVVADCVGGRNRWGGRTERGIPDLPLADWDALARVADQGAEMGCHSRRHPRLDKIDKAALEDETLGAREMLRERFGVVPTSYGYPYGAAGPRERDVIARHFERAVTTEHRGLGDSEDPCLLPRLDLFYFNRPGALNAFGRPGFSARITARAALRRIRQVAAG